MGTRPVIVDVAVWMLLLNNALVVPLCSPIVWFWLLPIWLTLGIFSWVRLRDMRYLGRGHSMLIHKQAGLRIRSAGRRSIRPSLEHSFLSLMRHRGDLGVGRYCWGEFYENFAMTWSHGGLLIACAVYVLMLRLVGEELGGLALILLGLLAVCVRLPSAPDRILLVPAGRRERILATSAIAIATSVVLAVLGLVIVVASRGLSSFVCALPVEYIRHRSEVLRGIDPDWFYWPCLLVPWVIASRLLWGWTREWFKAASH